MPVDPAEAFALFSRDYFLMALFVSLGTVQIAVAAGSYRGLYLLPWRSASRAAGIGLIVVGVLYFFLSPLWIDGPWAAGSVEADSSTRLWGRAAWADLGAARNVNDVDGGLSGGSQALWFPVAACIALTVSIAAGFIGLKFRGSLNDEATRVESAGAPLRVDGLDAMRESDYQVALGRSVAEARRSFTQDIVQYWHAAPSWSIVRLIATRLGR